jgi:hypothetical protein
MSVCRIFRVENSDQHGPYRSEIVDQVPALKAMMLRHDKESEAHPFVFQDRLVRINKSLDVTNEDDAFRLVDFMRGIYFFGFSSIKQLRDWFTEDELVLLQNNNFNLTVYTVSKDELVVMAKQVIFKKSSAKVLFKQNLISLTRTKDWEKMWTK